MANGQETTQSIVERFYELNPHKRPASIKPHKYVGREREYQREYYQQHRKHYNAMRRLSYRNNIEQRQYHKNYRWQHPEYRQRQIELGRQNRLTLKVEVLTHYGNKKCACVKCSESRLACLSIDHIKGGGSAQRQSGTSFYKWLKDNKFPRGFQTLCMNCQFVKRIENNELPRQAN